MSPIAPARPAKRRLPALRPLIAAACLAVSALGAVTSPAKCARAAETYKNSLDWVPADASFYAASFHLKDQVDRVAASNAWKAFRQIPSVAMGWSLAESQINNPEGPAAMFWQIMALPENKQLAQVGAEMVSEEIVMYGGANFNKLLELLQVVNNSRFSQFEEMVKGIEADESAGDDAGQSQFRHLLEAIKDDPSLVDVPELTFAFRIKDPAAATTQLARLEIFANMGLEQSTIGAKFERRKVGESEFLVLYLDGSMIPWPEETPEGDEAAENYEAIKDILSKKKLYLSFGVWNDYVVLSINRATDHLARLGAGESIGSRDEFASLARFKERTLVGAHYVSEQIAASQAIKAADIEKFASQMGAAVNSSSSVPTELKSRIEADLNELARDFQKYLPTPGAAAGYSFLNDDGYESFGYSWSQMPTVDGSKSLQLTNHLGGSPIFALVARGVEDPDSYDTIVKWVKRGYGYFKDVALPEMDEDEREKGAKVLATLEPFAQRFDEVAREKLVPALKDGQSALVLDADILSKKWHNDMPQAHTPLAAPELGIVVGVTDAKLLTEGMADCRQIINEALKAIEELKLDEDHPAGLQFPEPNSEETSGGTVYSWKLPADAGLDEQIGPCTAVGEHVAVVASSRALAERVLAERELTQAEAILGDNDEERAMVVGFQWAELMSAVEPWIIYGVRSTHIGEEEAAESDPSEDSAEVKSICNQISTGFNILRCFEGAWGDLRQEEGVWVTHSVSKFHDLAD